MIYRALCLILSVFLISCNLNKEKSIYLLFDRVDGLTEGSFVQTKGFKIGKVNDMSLLKDKVIVKVNLNPGFNIPIGSTFKLAGESLFNTRSSIEVTLGNEQTFYRNKDTIIALSSNDPNVFDKQVNNSKPDSNSIKSVKKVIQGVNELLKLDSSK